MSHFYITAGLTAVSFYIIYRWLLSRRHLFSVENKVILITGATSGLGEGLLFLCDHSSNYCLIKLVS